jgi:hypothetical protein
MISPSDFLAQANPTLNGIFAALAPASIWAWLCYIIIVLDLAAMLLEKRGSLQLTLFMAASILAALINILGASGKLSSGQRGIFQDMLQSEQVRFGNWMVGIVMFVFPLVYAGSTKTGRSRGPALLAGIFAMLYVFGRWLTMPK